MKDEYANEGIQWTSVQFFDNQPRLDLLAKPPHGLIHILADATGFPKVFFTLEQVPIVERLDGDIQQTNGITIPWITYFSNEDCYPIWPVVQVVAIG